MKQNTSKGRKALVVGIIGAFVVLAAVLALLLTQCVGGGNAPTEQTQPQEQGYQLYWNLDKAEFAGQSEAGMSSRKKEADGYYHVRFFKDGEVVELKVADRKVVNAIDINDLMGLEFDEDGIVTGVIRADKMALERVGWHFYVQSVGGNLIKINSSRKLDGLEVLLEIEDYTQIYDMTGLEGPVGQRVIPSEMDRVIAIADLEGRITHVFITDRSEFMFTHEAECVHCKQTVEWKEWTKTDEVPTLSGHYILQNDIRMTGGQAQLPEECAICMDLNGKTITHKKGGRMIALFYPGCKLAIMDSSEEQTGTIKASGSGNQGLCVWVRYGEFHFYSGTLDGSGATTTTGGVTAAVDANAFMYMHGGTIIGGEAPCIYYPEKDLYNRGIGGAMLVSGKFVMNGGVIRDGRATSIITYKNGQPVYNRGFGGNIYAAGEGAVLELNGGVIQNGYAGRCGGNIYVDGQAEIQLNGTVIKGGRVDGKGTNGGSVYIGSKVLAKMTGGAIIGGTSRNEGGNVYCGADFIMTGGTISGGRVYNFATGKLKEDCASRNFFLVNGAMKMSGGTIAGGFHAIDTSKTRVCSLTLSGSAKIDGGEETKNNLTLNTSGDGVKLYVNKLSDRASIGVTSLGVFSEKTDAANADNFFSDIGGDVIHYQDCLAVGKLGCICGSDKHYGACDGTQQLWVPHNKNNTLPVTAGYWYLTEDIQLPGQQNIRGEQVLALDLNGHTVTTNPGSRAYALFDEKEPITLTLTDSSKEKTGAIKAVGKNVQAEGQCVWIRTAGQTVNLYEVTLDASGAVSNRNGAAVYTNKGTTFNMYAGRIVGGTAQGWYKAAAKGVANGYGGNVYVNGTFNMYGGTIEGGKALAAINESAEGKPYASGVGGNLAAGGSAQVNLLGGTIQGGHADTSGGNLYFDKSPAVKLDGVKVLSGTAGDATKKTSGAGGNITVNTQVTIGSATEISGGKGLYNTNGGNINITTTGKLTLSGTVTGGKADRGGNVACFGVMSFDGKLAGGSADTGGNLFVYGAKAAVTLSGGKLEMGSAKANGGNIHVGADGAALTLKGAAVTDGTAKNGGNLSVGQKTVVTLTKGTVANGTATENGGNIYAANGQLKLDGASISGGNAATGGNVYLLSGAEGKMTGGTVTGGKATVNAGNIYIHSDAAFTLAGGTVEKGVITKDGAGNIDARGKLTVTGGTVAGGVRMNQDGTESAGSNAKINIFAYKGVVEISGGTIDGGVMIHTDATTLKLSKDACIAGKDGKPGLTLNAGAMITLGQMSDKANVVISNATVIQLAASGEKTGLSSDCGLRIINKTDGSLWLAPKEHTHCSANCGLEDGQHADGCDGTDVVWVKWDGSDITQPGNYCVHGQLEISKPANVTASDVTLLVYGSVRSSKRAIMVAEGAKLTLTGEGTVEGKGVNNEGTGVIGVDGQLVIEGVTLRQIADSGISVKNGGVITVGTTGHVTMNGGTIKDGVSSNGGGNVFVNGGRFTMNGGTIQNGTSGVGGNVFVYSGSFTMAEDNSSETQPKITGGHANAKNGGNVNITAGASFTMETGRVENGYNSGGDGPGNFYVGGTLNISGGTVTGGYRVNDNGQPIAGSYPKGNIFCVNGTVDLSGGQVDGGVMVYGSAAERASLNISKSAKIGLCANGTGLSLYQTTVTVDETELTADARIVLTYNDNNKVTVDKALAKAKTGTQLTAATATLFGADADGILTLGGTDYKLVLKSDGKLYLCSADFHTHCSNNCGLLDGQHKAGCDGTDVPWVKWNGGNITEPGTYCVHDMTLEKAVEVSATGVTLEVFGKLSAPSDFVLTVKEGAELTLQGSGIVEGNGRGTESGAVIRVSGGRLVIRDVTIQRKAGATNATSVGGVLQLSSGTVEMYSGTIQNGTATNGGNVNVGGGSFTMYGGTIQNGAATNGGNVFVTGGSFTMAENNDSQQPQILNGSATGRGGNVGVNGGAVFTQACGTVKDGYMTNSVDGAGNFDVRGTLNVTGGTITGGYKTDNKGNKLTNSITKGNIFCVNGTVNLSGGQVDGGVMVYGSAAERASLNISKSAKLGTCANGTGLSLHQTTVTVDETELTADARIALTYNDNNKVTVDKALAKAKTGTQLTDAAKTLFGADANGVVTLGGTNYKLTLESGALYLRAGSIHAHCLCGSTDGKHSQGCDGTDVIFQPTTTFPVASGNYYVNADSISTGALQLGKSDGTGAVDIIICLHGKTITTPESNTARVALIWKNSSLTITDCGNGNITPNTKTVGNGSIFHPAAGSTLKLYKGTLDASGLSTAKNGPAIDNAGTLYIYGGTIKGGTTTLNGGAINNSGTVHMYGGTIQGGKANRGGSVLNTGSFTMYDDKAEKTGPVITGGVATNRGGNVYQETGSFTMDDGKITDGAMFNTDGAGNFDIRGGSLTLSGGEISGGKRVNAQNVAVALSLVKRNLFATGSANVTVTGGEIKGGVNLFQNGVTFKLSGDAVIGDGTANNLTLQAGTNGVVPTIAIGKDGFTGSVKISGLAQNVVFAKPETGSSLVSGVEQCFTHDSGYTAALEGGQLLFK